MFQKSRKASAYTLIATICLNPTQKTRSCYSWHRDSEHLAGGKKCLEITVLDQEGILFTSVLFIVKKEKTKPTTIFWYLKVKLASLHLSSKLRRINYSEIQELYISPTYNLHMGFWIESFPTLLKSWVRRVHTDLASPPSSGLSFHQH